MKVTTFTIYMFLAKRGCKEGKWWLLTILKSIAFERFLAKNVFRFPTLGHYSLLLYSASCGSNLNE